MRLSVHTIIFGFIFLLAFLFRFYQLGSFPQGLTWDEAAIGYNAYGIAAVHRDEWLSRMPIVFRSFGDYKSPLGIYITAVLFFFFAPSDFLIRLPVAVAGAALVVVSYFLTRKVLEGAGTDRDLTKLTSLLVMLLVALSPWAIHFSRIAFESMLAATLLALAVLLFLIAQKKPIILILSIVCAVLSLYAYHSGKIVTPLVFMILFVQFRSFVVQNKKVVAVALITGIITGLPLLYVSVFGRANDRALSTTILSSNGEGSSFLRPLSLLSKNLVSHLRPSYLLQGDELTYRHSTKIVGISHPVELILFFYALVSLRNRTVRKKLGYIPVFFALSFLPAIIGKDVPHANRMVLGMPWLQIGAGIGFASIYPKLNNRFRRPFLVLLGTAMAVSTLAFVFAYQKTYTSSLALTEFGYGYEELLTYVRKEEGKYSTVYFTNIRGQAYIYLLLYKHLDPISYRGGGLANYFITDDPWKESNGKTGVLVVGTGEQIPDDASIVYEKDYPDGKVAFRVAAR